jgi:hypothetical protein
MMALLAWGGSPGSPAVAARGLRLVGPVVAIVTPSSVAASPGSLEVGFRLDRLVGETAQGNARITAQVDGHTAEFVSRVARTRYHCYAIAPVDAPSGSSHDGGIVHIVLRTAGQRLTTTARVRVSATPGAVSPRPPHCAGRKQRLRAGLGNGGT